MTLPLNYVLIRHGQSEQNRVFSYKYRNEQLLLRSMLEDRDKDRHESTIRLTKEGAEQARVTGAWVRDNLPTFDQFYVSPHVRARETAGLLGLDGQWRVDDRFRERDWGEASGLTEEGEEKITPSSDIIRKLNPWLWKPLGGESLATGTRARVELVMDSLHRKKDHIQSIVAVTHGEFMRTSRFVIERMTPEMFNSESLRHDRGLPPNCGVLHYTRQNPDDATDVRMHYHWKRLICPWDENKSINNGDWVKFDTPTYSDADLLDFANQATHIFKDELNP